MTYEEMILALEARFEGMKKEKQISECTRLKSKDYTNGFILNVDGNQSIKISTGEVFFVTFNEAFSDGPYFAYEDDDRKEVIQEIFDTVERLVGGRYIISDRKVLGFTIRHELHFLDQDGEPMMQAIKAKR